MILWLLLIIFKYPVALPDYYKNFRVTARMKIHEGPGVISVLDVSESSVAGPV